MDKQRVFFLVSFVFLATIGLWLRGDLFGVDSYATWIAVRFGDFSSLGTQPIANIVWGLLPDSLVVFKGIMFLSILSSVVPLFLLVKHFYSERDAWFSVFLLFGLSPLVLFGFGEFENEVLAYPFLLWSVYFLLLKKPLKSLIFCLFGTAFWFWPFYLTFFNFGSASGYAVERNMFAGLLNFWFLLPFLFFIPLLDKRLRNFGLIAVGLWLWNAKLFIFLVPFVVLAIPKGLYLLRNKGVLRNSLFYIAFFGLFAWNIAFLLQSPTQNDWFLVRESVKLSQETNLPVLNDWSYGYYLKFVGYETPYLPSNGNNPALDQEGIYLTKQDLNCELVAEKKEFSSTKKIWKC